MEAAEQARLEALEAQLEELEAVRACYDEDLLLAAVEQNNLQFAAAVVARSGGSGGGAARAVDVPSLSGTLRLPGVCLSGQPVDMAFVLPKQGGAPSLQVHTNASRQDAGRLQQVADSVAAECAADGAPCLLVAASQLAEAAQELAEQEAAAVEQQQASAQALTAGSSSQAGAAGQRQPQQHGGALCVLSRRCIVFHHIKNLSKRKAIVQWGGELGLGGWSKPGFPGVVLVEGAVDNVAEYVSRLRQLRWQSMAVRAEEDLPLCSQQELEAARAAPQGVQELGEEEMGRLAAAARAAGMEALFREALGLAPAAGS
ncbi:hypothetical protein ABPG75_008827 [Micractinium tetrahymenae]